MAKTPSFGPLHIIEPTSPHTNTIILLHGRGSNGPEFASELFSTKLSLTSEESLQSRFPSCRWVFPSSQLLWSTAFNEKIPAWFEAHSLTNISDKAEWQIPGLRDSVAYVKKIIEEEVERVGGDVSRVVLGGFSLGGAVGGWLLLSMGVRFGGFVGCGTWLPFYGDVGRFLDGEKPCESRDDDGLRFVSSMMDAKKHNSESVSKMPIFFGHGTDDAWINVELGRAARDIFIKAGYSVEWKEYTGAEMEGHWVKEPEQMIDIASFLTKAIGNP
jgi:lysophospholipase II